MAVRNDAVGAVRSARRSAHQGDAQLADGRHHLVYNHSGHRATEAKGNRYPLDIALSRDGISWKRVLTLEHEPCSAGYSYPAVIQSRDGLIHVTYTWDRKMIKHVVLDPARL